MGEDDIKVVEEKESPKQMNFDSQGIQTTSSGDVKTQKHEA